MNTTHKALPTLRIDQAAVARILEQLDKLAGSSPLRTGRRSQRYDYRVSAVVSFPQIEGASREAVPCRNISRDGIGFLLGRFVYPGTTCQIHLVSEYNHGHSVEGVVRRCRYLSGTAGVHEVGVQFAKPIDIAMFHRGAASLRVLLVDSDATQRALFEKTLAANNAEVVLVSSAEQAVNKALRSPFDLVLMNMDDANLKSCDVVKLLREKGYVRPISAITARGEEDLEAQCNARKCQHCRPVMLDRKALPALITQLKNEPITSSLAGNAEVAPMINEFVFGLQRWVGDLETAFGAKEFEKLTGQLRRMAVFAEGCGFDIIADATENLAKAIAQRDEPAKAQEQLNALVRFCLAARPASAVDPDVGAHRA
ncbi:MAG: PilZ domain-containing protein [Phycisphaerae bacterium]